MSFCSFVFIVFFIFFHVDFDVHLFISSPFGFPCFFFVLLIFFFNWISAFHIPFHVVKLVGCFLFFMFMFMLSDMFIFHLVVWSFVSCSLCHCSSDSSVALCCLMFVSCLHLQLHSMQAGNKHKTFWLRSTASIANEQDTCHEAK